MLQPRVGRTPRSRPHATDRAGANDCHRRTAGHVVPTTATKVMAAALLGLLLLPATGWAHNTDIVEPTPALRLNDADLTTVLLVKNEHGRPDNAHGRFLNVRPEVGLLTSTARTFIQEGVTTEYATQVLGTTLENGRLYAQLLKKSSRVLYEPSVVTSWVGENLQTKALLQSHNDLSNVDQPDWQDIDDRLVLQKNAFVGNTDFVGLIDLRSLRNQNDSRKFATSTLSSSSSTTSSSSGSKDNVVVAIGVESPSTRPSGWKATVAFGTGRPRPGEEDVRRIAANKVLPIGDLPTYTVKNYFAPSGFSWEDGADGGYQDSAGQREESQPVPANDGPRSPKLYYNQLMGAHGRYTSATEPRPTAAPKFFPSSRVLSTVTYYGFADFTTVVGDSVIVFSPSTQAQVSNFGHVTSIKGEATLVGAAPHSLHASVSNVPITVTQDLIQPTYVEKQAVLATKQAMTSTATTTEPTLKEGASSEEANEEGDEPLEEVTTSKPAMDGNAVLRLQASELDGTTAVATNTTTTEASASTSQPVLLSRPSDEDILRIYSSLASAEAVRKSAATAAATEVEPETRSAATAADVPEATMSTSDVVVADPTTAVPVDIQTQGGATTIFFEDDPFANFIKPTAVKEVRATTAADTSSEPPANPITNPTTTTGRDESSQETTTAGTTASADEETTAFNGQQSEADMDVTQPATETTVAEPTDSEMTPESTTPKVVAKVIVKELNGDEDGAVVSNCMRTSQVFLTQLPKTLTYYTTYLSPDNRGEGTATSVETNVVPTFDIEPATKHYCIQSTTVLAEQEATSSVDQLERPSTFSEGAGRDEVTSTSPMPTVLVRQSQEMTVTEGPTTDTTEAATEASGAEVEEGVEVNEGDEDEEDEEEEDEEDEEEEGDDDSAEEIDLIYKTLYTTYTYLTTFFHDDTTSISSHKEVVTNVITSTLRPGDSDIQATKLSELLRDNDIAPATKFMVPTGLESILREEEGDAGAQTEGSASSAPTAYLDDRKLTKTYFTTYTYYTTIFADGETEVMSRTEVYTNYVTDSRSPNSTLATAQATEHQHAVYTTVHEEENAVLEPTSTVETRTTPAAGATITESGYGADPQRGDHMPVHQEYSSVTDVRSSSSNGDHQIINHNNQINSDPFDDQISSESNTDEIIPSATLLLQTSFTTFTYYTTMYSGDNTNVVSRLETVTTVVTETLEPTKTLYVKESTLPITYFTTFTYWTKLSKDGEITTLSREETVSNVVTPTNVTPLSIAATTSALPSDSADQAGTGLPQGNGDAEGLIAVVMPVPGPTEAFADAEPTTYYTTYTYYTTSYVGEQTITDSRFETVTNVVTPTDAGPSPDVEVTASRQEDPVTMPSAPSEASVSSAGPRVISYDQRRIIDADGVSTLFFTTQVVATPAADAGDAPVEVTSSSSSLYVDEAKKSLLPAATAQSTVNAEGSTIRQYKTGLVRLIEGTKVANHTTTLYQSKVIGTVIDNRYAQIIESTSSFLIDKTKVPLETTIAGAAVGIDIAPTATQVMPPILQSTQTPVHGAVPQVQGSLADDHGEEVTESPPGDSREDEDDHEHEEGDEEADDNRGRFPLQSKKRTFTPVIRPFASRNRPQFAPKKKNVSPSSATIITRSDFTPTITATPALKSPGGRFSSSRRGGFASNGGAIASSSGFGSSASSSRRFSRPSKASVGPNQPFGGSGTLSPSSVGGFGGARNRISSSRLSPASSRRTGPGPVGRSSSTLGGFYGGNSRLRIKPTATLGFEQESTDEASLAESSEDEGAFTQEAMIEGEEEETATENSNLRRYQNPLLRFRRPLPANRPSGFTPAPRSGSGSAISTRRNPLAARAKITTSTTTTTTTPRPKPRSFQRPALGGGFQGRTRPQSNLFPPRGLFQAQTQLATGQDLDDGDKRKGKDGEEDLNDGAGDDDSEYEEDDDDEDGEEDGDEDVNRRRRSNKVAKPPNSSANNPLVPGKRPAKTGARVKRDTDVTTRSNFRNRFRRPKPTSPTAEGSSADEPSEAEAATPPVATTRPRVGAGRFSSRYHGAHHTPTTAAPATTTSSHRAIRPSRPTAGRAQFTLREKDTATTQKGHVMRPGSGGNFRRPLTAASSRRTLAPMTTKNSRRLKNYGSGGGAGSESTSSRTSSTGRSRGGSGSGNGLGGASRNRGSSVRARSRGEFNSDPVLPTFDGMITVTHVLPTEVTIPVVNGKLTEYKNVVTAKTSTEVLAPQQYTSFVGPNGHSTLVLTREDSTVNFAGATEITQYVLHETPTTTVIFTPTTIRGRKTSFSHVIPSTVYSVENVVSTAQPQISANAPLANILLSQLLLGNIGLPANPLLGALGGAVTAPGPLGAAVVPTAATPVTEYRTHTSTYVTTLVEGMSTVIPVTFQGKKILTTIYDTTAQTITATEFITDTIVTTPTQQPSQAAQVNSLLLQQLLLQQQLQQTQQTQQKQPLLPLQHADAQSPLLLAENLQELDTNNIRVSNDADDLDDIQLVEETHSSKSGGRKKARKSGHKRNKQHQAPPPQESSVITLYVSGRRPGEFSTILSTVPVGYDSSSTHHKRQVRPTALVDTTEDFYAPDGSEIVSEYSLPESNSGPGSVRALDSSQLQLPLLLLEGKLESNTLSDSKEQTTQSLESIVGDVSLWYAKSTAQYERRQELQTELREAASGLPSSLGAASEEKSQHFLF